MVALLVTPGIMALGALRRSVRANIRRWGPLVTSDLGREAMRDLLRALHSCTDLCDLWDAVGEAETRLFQSEAALTRAESLRLEGERIPRGAA